MVLSVNKALELNVSEKCVNQPGLLSHHFFHNCSGGSGISHGSGRQHLETPCHKSLCYFTTVQK